MSKQNHFIDIFENYQRNINILISYKFIILNLLKTVPYIESSDIKIQ
jgi:hypothetical protein